MRKQSFILLAVLLAIPAQGRAQPHEVAEIIGEALSSEPIAAVVSHAVCEWNDLSCEKVGRFRWEPEPREFLLHLARAAGAEVVSPQGIEVPACQGSERQNEDQAVGYLVTLHPLSRATVGTAVIWVDRQCMERSEWDGQHRPFERTDQYELEQSDEGWKLIAVSVVRIT